MAKENSFKTLPPSIFVYKGMRSHLELIEKNLDDAVETKRNEQTKNFVSSWRILEITWRWQKSNIRNSFPSDEEDEAIPGKTEDDMRKLPLIYGGGKPGNTAHKMLSIEVDKLKTFCQWYQVSEKDRQIYMLVTKTFENIQRRRLVNFFVNMEFSTVNDTFVSFYMTVHSLETFICGNLLVWRK